MKIHGIQKMTLLDFPGHVSCTIFLGGCDFRCPFCHNFELLDGTAKPVMDENELIDFLEKRRHLLDGVAITGGEPCLHSELIALIKRIRSVGYKVKLGTNGYHPDVIEKILYENLVDYIAMDIKNSEKKYAMTCGVAHVDINIIKKTISLLQNSSVEYEFRTTVVKPLHEENDFYEIGSLIKGSKRYFLQRFADRDTVPFGNLSAPSFDEMKKFAEISRHFVNDTRLRGVE